MHIIVNFQFGHIVTQKKREKKLGKAGKWYIVLRGHFGHGAISATLNFVLFWMCYDHSNTPNTHTGKCYCTL